MNKLLYICKEFSPPSTLVFFTCVRSSTKQMPWMGVFFFSPKASSHDLSMCLYRLEERGWHY